MRKLNRTRTDGPILSVLFTLVITRPAFNCKKSFDFRCPVGFALSPPPPPRGPFLGPKFAPPSVVGRQPDCRPTARLSADSPTCRPTPDIYFEPPCRPSANSGATGRLSAFSVRGPTIGRYSVHGPTIGLYSDHGSTSTHCLPICSRCHLWVNSSMPLLLNNSSKRPRT
ncbi:hypothetical protein M8J77_002508 [Diaphorina citri]|nr:hypothetical protein M8J77_002508 [Diaphorina citri]